MVRFPTLLLAAVTLLAGCQSRLPTLAAPTLRTAAPLANAAAAASGDTGSAWPDPHWWERYGDPELNALVERALQVSPTLAAAAARQARAVAAVQLQAANSGVRISGNAQVQRQRISDNGLFPPALLGISWYSISDLGLDINYQPDMWRRQAEALRAVGAEARAAEAEHAQVGVTLAASVAQLYFTMRADAAAARLAQQAEAIAQRNRDIAAARQSAALASGDEVRRLDLQLLSARDAVDVQATNLALHRVALAALLDETPEQLPQYAAAALPALPLQLPAGATLGLVARRGDLSAARWRVESNHANAAVARKGYLPDLSLRAMLGLSSRDIGKLLSAGSAAPAFTAALSLPLFDAGATRARYGSATAQLDAAIADYHAVLLLAAREVNEALALRDSAVTQLESSRARVADAEALRANAELQLQHGLSDARPLLGAETQLLNQRAGLLQTQRLLVDADLTLIRALGGGYEEKHRE
jgi:outer membrane protein, multidrug efflux system